MIHYTSIIIPLLILLPNALFLLFPPIGGTEEAGKGKISYQIAEGVGRIGVILTPLFYPMYFDQPANIAGMIGMLLFLGIYLFCWMRYIIRKSDYTALFAPLLKLPVPMAWSPIMYFVCASVMLHSLPLFCSALVLAIGHIPASLTEAKRLRG